MLTLNSHTTALVLIDLQKGILNRTTLPHSCAEVLERASTLAKRFREREAPVFLVRVRWSPDLADLPSQLVDEPMQRPPGGFPPEWSEFPADLVAPTDIIVTKQQWGAFYGTGLDLELRRRRMRTIVLGGIATNFGVESTARSGWEHGYEIVVAEDATASTSAELHTFSVKMILPRIARLTKTVDIVLEP